MPWAAAGEQRVDSVMAHAFSDMGARAIER
jgi:hypothetical protein